MTDYDVILKGVGMATFAVVNRSQGDKHATTRQLRMLFDQRFLLTAHYIQINHRDALYSYQEKKN